MADRDTDIVSIFATDDELIEVAVGALAIAEHPYRLMTPALGSCVGVSIYDPLTRRGTLAHVMLPVPHGSTVDVHSARFADFAVPEMIRLMVERGSLRRRMVAKIAGGAMMFRADTTVAGIGERNVAEVKRQLDLMSIPLVAEDTGEAHARTIELDLETGELSVRSFRFGVIKL